MLLMMNNSTRMLEVIMTIIEGGNDLKYNMVV